MNDCSICKKQTDTISYSVYSDSTDIDRLKDSAPGKAFLTGNTIRPSGSGDTSTYAEYGLHLCRECMYGRRIRIDLIIMVSAMIVGGIMKRIPLPYLSWVQSIVYLIGAGYLIALLVHVIKYMSNENNEGLAASAVGKYLNKGLEASDRIAYYSFSRLDKQKGK